MAVIKERTRLEGPRRGWLAAGGLALLLGCLLGRGMTGGWTHAGWPALAGLALGLSSALAAPLRPVRSACWSGGVAVAAAVAMIALVQLQRGHWPIRGEDTIAMYGTAGQATARAAVLLGGLVGVPCLMTAVLVAALRRRWARAASSEARAARTARGA